VKENMSRFKNFECDILHNQKLCQIYQLNKSLMISIGYNFLRIYKINYCEMNFIVIYVINSTFAGSLVIKRIDDRYLMGSLFLH